MEYQHKTFWLGLLLVAALGTWNLWASRTQRVELEWVDPSPINQEEIPMTVSWEHETESGGILTIEVTQERNESLPDFQARVEAAQDIWPPRVPQGS